MNSRQENISNLEIDIWKVMSTLSTKNLKWKVWYKVTYADADGFVLDEMIRQDLFNTHAKELE
jgi:hypothetical protein